MYYLCYLTKLKVTPRLDKGKSNERHYLNKREIINTLNKLRSLAIFINFTTTLSKTKDITVYLIFAIYNKLFDYLKKSIK
ncbi:uncharacterized protein N7496_004506 [Penicillium cataractarum]|uniref:Uncharacterized protein n=1 Tax=Penicillium cataractarum TaxID=2100454 RepID=A0A9W9STA0_9EURO|nr:uncharacterized protein N7496_004506 [Penicillium cataractarum]KAJ5382078.1 hypothetical protein N7496_004506 [Penicillium cataractarum]